MRSVKYDKTKYRAEYLVSHGASERAAYPIFKNALNDQVRPVIDAIKRMGWVSAAMVELLVPIEPMQRAYAKVYELTGLKFARRSYNWINSAAKGNKASAADFYNETWRQLLIQFYQTQSAQRIAEVTQTTIEDIQRLLAEAERLGLGISETAGFMLTRLDNRNYTRRRALVITRTETTAAANYGAYIGGQSSDYEVGKSWLHIMDKNTRPAHARMDDTDVIPYDAQFVVGGEPMSYPGDLSANASNVIQCRCSLCVVPLVDEDGLPILK